MPGFRDKITGIANALFERNEVGKLVMTTSAPMFTEAMKRFQKTYMDAFHEGYHPPSHLSFQKLKIALWNKNNAKQTNKSK